MYDKMNKLILLFIPTNSCNLKCEYCLVSHTNEWDRSDINFKYPVEHIIKALSPERLGGSCFINLTAQGETLLYKDVVKLIDGLLKYGHHVEIITNGMVENRIDEILSLSDELIQNLFFKISYHYEELTSKGIINKFWNNVNKIKNSPCSYTLEIMPNDKLVNHIDDACSQCMNHVGALCHATVGRDDSKNGKELLTSMSKEDYVKTWSKLDSTMFKLKMELFGVKRKEFCYAGKWSLLIDISSGEAEQCYGRMNTQNVFKDLSKPIHFVPVGHTCTQAYCFNGHAHIAWGMIPEYKSATYFEIRNRNDVNGDNWVKSGCEGFFKQKLSDNNRKYSKIEKILFDIYNPFYLLISLFHDIPGVKRKAKKFYKIITGKFSAR